MDYIHDITSFLPGILIAVTGLVVIVMEAMKNSSKAIYIVTVAGTAAALFAAIESLFGGSGTAFSGMIVYGGVGAFGSVIVLL